MVKQVNTSHEVIVAGAGPAGITAAIAAARAGAKTLVLDRCGYVGGHLSGCIILHGFFDQAGTQVVKGIPFEIVERLRELNAAIRRVDMDHPSTPATIAVDHEVFKYVAMEMILESGAELLLDTVVTGALVENGNQIRGVEVFNKSGAASLLANVVVDATGDADVTAFAGGRYLKGRQSDGLMQPMTLFFSVSGADPEALVNFMKMPSGRSADPPIGQEAGVVNWFDATLAHWADELASEGLYEHVDDKSTIDFSGYVFRPNEMVLNATFINGLDPTVEADRTAAYVECHRQAIRLVGFLRDHVPGFEHAEFRWSAPTVFVRESRRIVGDYVLTYEDFRSSAHFDDVIARSGYIAAIHDPEAKGGLALDLDQLGSRDSTALDIPYRALLPKGLEGLVTSGRCISAEVEALSSARTAGAAMATGHAAGAAAALAVRAQAFPRDLDVSQLQGLLRDQGADVRKEG